MVSAFVKLCHPETNTFHMSFGEMTITLYDVRHVLSVRVEIKCIYYHDGGRDIKLILSISLVKRLLGIHKRMVSEEC